MIFFGIVLFTSWVGSFLSLSQSLPPITSQLTPTKVSSNLGKLVIKTRPFFVPPQQQVNVWSATLLPSRFLRMDWGNKESRSSAAKSPNAAVTALKSSKLQFCPSSLKEIVVEPSSVKTTSVLPSAKLLETSSPNREFIPNRILRSLQNFFRLNNAGEQDFSSASSQVNVVHRKEADYEVWVNNRAIASLPNKLQANLMQERLTRLVKSSNLDAFQLKPALVDGIPALMAGNRFLFGIGDEISRKTRRSPELLAIEWVNNLRLALQAPALSLVEGQLEMYGLQPSQAKMSGLASWYGPYFHGRLTANGERFNQNELTVAHKSLPFNTFLQVTNLKTNKSVVVRVNDRGPYIPPRSLDLSLEAARCIDSETAGVVPYKAVILHKSEPKMTLKGSHLLNKNQKSPGKMAVVSDF
jgi:rare lipoprotein A